MQDRKLAAIMFADIVSYSRLMGANESEALKILNDFEEISAKIVEKFQGIIIKKNGDQIFCEFSSAKNAVDASLELQDKLSEYNDSRPKDYKLEVRIGIHIGDIVKKNNDIFGDGVNVAARIQPLASPGGICVSGAVSESLSSHPDYDIISKGEQELKNILQKHTIFQVKTGHETIELVRSKISKKTKEKSSNPNAKYWILISPFLLIAVLFSFVILQKIVKDAIKSFSNETNTVESVISLENNSDILLFGNIFSEPEDIPDITLFYEKGTETTLPDKLELYSLSKIELNNIYDELLSSIQANVFIGDLEVHSKYDLDKFYKEKNDLVPEYKIKTFSMLRKIATGEINISDASDPKSEDFKIFEDQLYNSDTYIMGQYHRVGLGYFPIIYKLSNSYKGGDYLVVGHIKYDTDPREAMMQIDPKWEMQIVNEANIVSELTEMLVTLLSQTMTSYNKTENLLDRTLVVSKSSGDKILFKKHLFSKASDQNNKLNKLKARMMFDASRFYINKEMGEILDRSTLEAVAERRLNDLQEYKNKLDKNKNSKQYKEFYKDGDDVFAYDNNIEYQSLLNKTHALHTASENTRMTFIMPLGITVKIDEVFESTGSATIYKKDDPFKVLKEGDILIRK